MNNLTPTQKTRYKRLKSKQYTKGLNKEEYQFVRLVELEERERKGELADNMYPYYYWLKNGGKRLVSKQKRQAGDLINELSKRHSIDTLAKATSYSRDVLIRLSGGQYSGVPEDTAQQVYSELKGETE